MVPSSVNHSKDEYARLGGLVHSNTAESLFALLKRGIYGAFHSVYEAHLHRYLAEFDFRYSHRKVSDTERTEAMLRGMKGKRLLFQQPREAGHASAEGEALPALAEASEIQIAIVHFVCVGGSYTR